MTQPDLPDEQRSPDGEIDRARTSYRERDRRMPVDDPERNIYHPRHSLGRLLGEHHRELLIDGLNRLRIDPRSLHVLDVGCGHGAWLRHLVDLGALPGNLTGIDISEDRIRVAREKNPSIQWVTVDGNSSLAVAQASFDLVIQTVVFSSVLDEKVRQALAKEMERVLKPGGHIVWMDLKHGHGDELIGFTKSCVSEYFPSCEIVHARAADPRSYRRFHKRPTLAKLLRGISGYDAWFFILKRT